MNKPKFYNWIWIFTPQFMHYYPSLAKRFHRRPVSDYSLKRLYDETEYTVHELENYMHLEFLGFGGEHS